MRSSITGGAGAGLVATTTMTGVLWAGKRMGLVDRLPPEHMTEAVLTRLALSPRRERTLHALTAVAHLGYGVVWGGVFALLHGRLRMQLPPGGRGFLFGSVLWALSYAGWGPVARLVPPPWRTPPGWSLTLLPAHWVYGWALEAIVAR